MMNQEPANTYIHD